MKLYETEEMPTPKQVKNLAEKWHPLEIAVAIAGVAVEGLTPP